MGLIGLERFRGFPFCLGALYSQVVENYWVAESAGAPVLSLLVSSPLLVCEQCSGPYLCPFGS